MNVSIKLKIISILTFILLGSYLFLYRLDSISSSTIRSVSEAEVKREIVNIINEVVFNNYNEVFQYDNIIKIEKDGAGNIIAIKANTLQMNKTAMNIAIEIQKGIEERGDIKIKIPLIYIFRSNISLNAGPEILVSAKPVGNVKVDYSSEFESEGINQTVQKIYMNINTEVRIILPMESDLVTVKTKMLIAETVILGKVPQSNINLQIKDK